MKNIYKCIIILFIGLLVFNCDNGLNDGNENKNNNSPTITDIKIATDISQMLTGPYLTSLTVGKQYAVIIFGSDVDLDITKLVVKYFKDSTLVNTDEIPVFGQTTVSDAFLTYVTPISTGMWKVEAYFIDSKDNTSNIKSINVSVGSATVTDPLFVYLETLSKYTANNGNTVYFRKNINAQQASDLDDVVYDLAIASGYTFNFLYTNEIIPLSSIPVELQPNNGTYSVSYSVTPDKKTISCLYGARAGTDFMAFGTSYTK